MLFRAPITGAAQIADQKKKIAIGIKKTTIRLISHRRRSISLGSSFILRTLDLDQQFGF